LKASTDSILGLQELMPVIAPHHVQQLEDLANGIKGPAKSGNKHLLDVLRAFLNNYLGLFLLR